MKTIKGPAIFLAQFAGDTAPFNSLPAIAQWASSLGYKGVQIPSWDARLFDLKTAAHIRINTRFNILDPGAVHPKRYLVLRFTGSAASMAPDALALID